MDDVATPDSVRLALPFEAEQLAAVQRRAWTTDLPAPVSAALLAQADLAAMATAWQAAIVRPPLATCRVLVAVAASTPAVVESGTASEQRVAGFAVVGPSGDPDADPSRDAAVVEFVIDPVARRRGHGSRLMHAVVDTARADGFGELTWWVGSTDDVLRGFLTEAGWAPDGAHHEIGTDDDAGVVLRQVRLRTDIS